MAGTLMISLISQRAIAVLPGCSEDVYGGRVLNGPSSRRRTGH